MLGRSSEALEGVAFSTIFEPDEEDGAAFVSRRQSGAKSTRLKGKLLCHNGLSLPVRVSRRPMQDLDGVTIGEVVTIEDLSDSLQMSEYVHLMAHHDLPTGLPKIEAVRGKVDAAIRKLHASGVPFAMVEIGLDDFRRINESLGHFAGDRALYEIGRRIASSLGPEDVLARSAGDGFIILFPDCLTQEEAVRRASDLLRNFDEPFQVDEYCVRISAGLGVSFAAGDKVTQTSLFTECELALRRSKSLGGSRVLCFEPGMAMWHSSSVQMEYQMQEAIEREEFFVVYQPQICLKTGRLMGVEALLRWNSPANGLVMPNSFIPFAEETGLIVQLGEWCLRTACREVVQLQQRLGYPITLAVNVSPKQARAKGFRAAVQNALTESGLDPKYLEVEITEGLLISNEDQALRMIATLQEMGVSVAMDDFGMGFSNLGYITRFKVDRLKIDRSFVGRCTTDRSSKMITISILFLAKSLGIQVVAEGVETDEQAALLAGLECDMAQGYLYSRPTTIDEIYQQAQHFVPPEPMLHATGITEGAQQAWLSRMSSSALIPGGDSVLADEALPVQAPTVSALKKPATAIVMGKLAPETALSVGTGTYGFIEARDPLCRPTHPPRKPGSTRVRVQATDEEGDPYLVPDRPQGSQIKLLH